MTAIGGILAFIAVILLAVLSVIEKLANKMLREMVSARQERAEQAERIANVIVELSAQVHALNHNRNAEEKALESDPLARMFAGLRDKSDSAE